MRLTAKARRDALYRLRGQQPSAATLAPRGDELVEHGFSAPAGVRCTSEACEDESRCRRGGCCATAEDTPVDVSPPKAVRECCPRDMKANDDDGHGRRRRIACGMCGALLLVEDVGFRMTQRMIRRTLVHVSSPREDASCSPSASALHVCLHPALRKHPRG